MGWINFVKALRTTMEHPTYSDPFYYVPLIILAGLIVGLVFLNKKMNDKAYKYTLLGMWIVMIILEFFKQIIGSYCEVDGQLIVAYAFPFLPLHICSGALFLLPVIVFAKDSKIKKPFEMYCAVCLLIGGICAMAKPSWNGIAYLNYQTCIYHMLLVLSSLLIGLRTRNNFKINILGEAFIIYAFFLLLALLFNWLVPTYFPKHPQGWLVNFWGLSWIYKPSIPLIEKLWKISYPLYLFVYIHVHIAAGLIGYVLLSLIYNHKVTFKVKEDNKKKLNKNKKH